jgi:hypothetical protein
MEEGSKQKAEKVISDQSSVNNRRQKTEKVISDW